jgi:hypothetical protein
MFLRNVGTTHRITRLHDPEVHHRNPLTDVDWFTFQHDALNTYLNGAVLDCDVLTSVWNGRSHIVVVVRQINFSWPNFLIPILRSKMLYLECRHALQACPVRESLNRRVYLSRRISNIKDGSFRICIDFLIYSGDTKCHTHVASIFHYWHHEIQTRNTFCHDYHVIVLCEWRDLNTSCIFLRKIYHRKNCRCIY